MVCRHNFLATFKRLEEDEKLDALNEIDIYIVYIEHSYPESMLLWMRLWSPGITTPYPGKEIFHLTNYSFMEFFNKITIDCPYGSAFRTRMKVCLYLVCHSNHAMH